MNIVNLTPHELNVLDEQGEIVTIPASGNTARVESQPAQIGSVEGFAVTTQKLGEVTGLPEPKLDTIYIVSRMVAEAAKHRSDLYIPGALIRDDNGRVTGCDGLSQVSGGHNVSPSPNWGKAAAGVSIILAIAIVGRVVAVAIVSGVIPPVIIEIVNVAIVIVALVAWVWPLGLMLFKALDMWDENKRDSIYLGVATFMWLVIPMGIFFHLLGRGDCQTVIMDGIEYIQTNC